MNNCEMNKTNFNNLIAFLCENADKSSDEYRILSDYIELQKKRFIEEKNDGSRPFLTVITRTQGKRREMLNETFLSLTGQSNTDFEYIVVGHNLDGAQTETVTGLIDDMPLWMREKTRFFPVNGGTRTTPLIKGFEAAKGKYIAVLDDDDIVFDNWVEAFYQAYLKGPGKILHSYVVYQDWETVSDKYPDTPIAVGKPSNVYCEDFVMLNELTKNVCPLMSVAFPSYFYNTFKINFDETLTTTEDWDFLVRNAFICGVENNRAVTSIYRNWKNTENSQTLHKKNEWDKNYKTVVERFKTLPMIFDKTGISQYIDKKYNSGRFTVNAGAVEMFYDNGFGFNAGSSLNATESAEEGWAGEFDVPEDLGEISAIRIDPEKKGNICVFDLSVKLVFADNSERLYSLKDFKINGKFLKGCAAFLKDDPQLILKFSKGVKLKKVYFNFMVQKPVPDDYIDLIVNKGAFLLKKTAKKILSLIKR